MKLHLALCLVLISSIGCNNDKAEISEEKENPGITIVNGVERSELALTMRLMYDEMKLASDSIKAGNKIRTDYLERYKSIHTDHATEPEKIDAVYQSMAENFLSSYKSFEDSDTNQVVAFNQMLDACLACHQQKCPGPIKAIKKIRVNQNN